MEAAITFEQLGLIPPLVDALKDIGYETPTAIQASSIPVLLGGRDLLGQAQTGTGKTGAFALPLLNGIELDRRAPQVLVLTPTRELAIQVAEAFQSYARRLKGFHVLPIYGGQSMSNQLHQLKRGPHVVVGTPGRVMDHLRRKSLNLETLKALVLDEADEMLNMGFVEDIEFILEHTPTEKQIALFSATMPEPIRRVTKKYLRNQQEIKIKTKTSTVEAISQYYWLVAGVQKLDALTRILEVEEFDAALIFVRTKTATVELAEKLEARGHSCAALNGDLSQELRERTIHSMKNGDLDIIVATDVAARGLDVERISHVINYDIPHDPEAYVHRIGRTGRAGRSGKAILFVSPRERRLLNAIERTTRQSVEPLALPSKKDVSDRRIQRFKTQISEALVAQDLSFYLPIVQELVEEHSSSEASIAAALCYLLQQENPLIVEEGKVNEDRAPRERERESRRGPRSFGEDRAGERPFRRDRRRGDREVETGMIRYRIEVGRDHGVNPGNIVGAIANSSGIDGKAIGHIELFDEYSTVELSDATPRQVFSLLQDVRIRDRKLHIHPVGEGPQTGTSFKRNRPDKFRKERNSGEGASRQKGKQSAPWEKKGKKSKPATPSVS